MAIFKGTKKVADVLPAMNSGTEGKFLTNDGSSQEWATIDIPEKTSDLTNDSGFITAAQAPVTDVKVGTDSIVSSGVATVPMAGPNSANAGGTPGLVYASTNSYGGIVIQNDGQIQVYSAPNDRIDSRRQSSVITCSNLDYAVKAALTDGVGTAYTDTQKAAARTRIGAEAADSTILKQADVVDNLTTQTAIIPLSARQGYTLQSEILNLQSIGRFLAIWDCTTGLPTSNPPATPYQYRTGDYYRIGNVGETNYIPVGVQYTGTASTEVATEEVGIGDVFYFDGQVWRQQASSGGGTVQDVQLNGTTLLNGGIANIPVIDSNSVVVGAIKFDNTNYRNNSGVNWRSTGPILKNLTAAQLAERKGEYYVNFGPITTNNYDDAVRLALCDGIGTAYSSTEQAAAQSRLGLSELTAAEVDALWEA